MEFNEYYELSEINRKQFSFLNVVYYSRIVFKSRTYNEIEKNINLIENDKISYILQYNYIVNDYLINNFHLRWLFRNDLLEFDYNQFQKHNDLGNQYFKENFKKVAPDVNHIEMLIYNFNNEWKQNFINFFGIINPERLEKIYFENGFLNAYIEYEKNHKYLFEKISATATAPEQKNKVEVLINEPPTATAPEPQQINLHNNIFTNDNFLKFQRLFDEFDLDHTKRTDLRFILEKMKHENEIHKTTTLQIYIDWLNETYQFENPILELRFTNIKAKSNNNRLRIYNLVKL